MMGPLQLKLIKPCSRELLVNLLIEQEFNTKKILSNTNKNTRDERNLASVAFRWFYIYMEFKNHDYQHTYTLSISKFSFPFGNLHGINDFNNTKTAILLGQKEALKHPQALNGLIFTNLKLYTGGNMYLV